MGQKPKAFLSFAEADAAAVRRLRRRLDKYVIPRALRNGGPAKLGRLIPDRQSHKLGDLKQQLVASEWLIVCASPAAAASERVNGEIDTYILVNGGGRVLMLLLDGDPPAALPPRLRGRNPVIADFRPDSDGAELGFLKVISELLDVNLGTLRDHQATAERASAGGRSLTGAAFAALAAAASVGAAALWEQRDRAETMAGQAIDLGASIIARVETPDVTADMVAEAEQEFDALFARGVQNPRFVRQRAALLVQFSDIYRRRGDAVRARERALAAIAAMEALPEHERGSLEYVRALSLAAQAESAGGNEPGAVDYATRAVAAARTALADTGGAPARAALAAALGRLGEMNMRMGRPEQALPLFEEAIPTLEAVRDASPDDEGAGAELATGLNWLGDAQGLTGDNNGARATFERLTALTRAELARTPDDVAAQAAVGAALMKLGQIMVNGGDAEGAREPLEESLAIARRVASAAPNNADLQAQLSARLILTAQVQSQLGAPNAGLMEEAIAAARARVSASPQDTRARLTLADLLSVNGLRLERAREFTEARDAWRDAASALRELRAADESAAEITTRLAEAMEQVGALSRRLNENPAALSAYAEAVRLRRAAATAAPQSRAARAALAQTLHEVGLTRLAADNQPGARAAFDEAARLRVALAEEDANDEVIADLAVESLQQLARIQTAANANTGARRSLETARDILTRLAASNPTETRYPAALRRTEAGLRALPENP